MLQTRVARLEHGGVPDPTSLFLILVASVPRCFSCPHANKLKLRSKSRQDGRRMEAGRESRVSGEVAAYSDARTSVIATSPSSELRPLMPNFAQQQFRAKHVSVGSKPEKLPASICFPLCP